MKTKISILSLVFIFCSLVSLQAAVSITKASGWLETAYVEWSPLSGADSYNVYCKASSASDTEYKKIDGMLIRKYADRFRADAVGLAAGNYVLKVIPVSSGSEDASNAAVSASLEVKAHRREGFAFSSKSDYKTGSGAYNDNGTLKSGAQVIYLTAATAKIVELSVVTSNKNAITNCTGIGEILKARQKGYDKTPLAIRIIGYVTASDMGDAINSSGFIEVKGKNAYAELNTTIEGIGDDATLYGWGILIRQCGNVEVRNLGLMQFPEDGVSIDTKNHNIWIHNNDFFYGQNKGGDKDKGDGSLDSKTSGWITISYNHFWDSGKCNLLGNGTETPEYHTYHHNWYDHSDSRHPRVRFHTVHVYNNYFDGNSKYGIGATCGSNIFVENNYFRNCKRPMSISLQGNDLAGGGTGTFSKENGGMIKAFGNVLEGTSATTFSDQTKSATDFDAIVTASRDAKVSDTYKTKVGGTSYSNFDTDPAIMYAYSVQTAADAKTETMAYAGRINGGDFKFTFVASEDSNAEIIPALETAIKNYKGSVLSIGFGSTENPGDPTDPTDPGDDDPEQPEGAMTHNFTTQEKNSSFFIITGNLSTGKGEVNYNGMTLTQCLKMESATNITFTTDEEATLTLVFGDGFSGKVKINDVNQNPTAGILTIKLPAGSHSIKKGDTTNLFYMSVAYAGTSDISDASESGPAIFFDSATNQLSVANGMEINLLDVYSMTGALVKRTSGNVQTIDLSDLNAGNYVVVASSTQGVSKQIIIKK